MDAGHLTGFGRSLLEEDVVIQTSMGPILDRTKENLSWSDVAVADRAPDAARRGRGRRHGELPPGSVRSRERVRLPNASEMLVDVGRRWEDAALDRLTT